jgi:hypothetical protein
VLGKRRGGGKRDAGEIERDRDNVAHLCGGASFCMFGRAMTQGAHQVAQKSRTTTLPRVESEVKGTPLVSAAENAGAGPRSSEGSMRLDWSSAGSVVDAVLGVWEQPAAARRLASVRMRRGRVVRAVFMRRSI